MESYFSCGRVHVICIYPNDRFPVQHEAICDFPSKHFYDGRLKTALSVKTRGRGIVNLWPAQQLRGKDWPVVFCHVEGKEESTIFKSAQSNAQSKSNMKEVMKAVSQLLRYWWEIKERRQRKKTGSVCNRIVVWTGASGDSHSSRQNKQKKMLISTGYTDMMPHLGRTNSYMIVPLQHVVSDKHVTIPSYN